jgi:hypothetical protein
MLSFSRNLSASNSNPTLIIILKSPRVKNTTGKAIKVIIGLTKALIRPITTPAIKRSAGVPVKIKPGKYLVASKIATQLAKILRSSFIELVVA